jgi:hypothetical protein
VHWTGRLLARVARKGSGMGGWGKTWAMWGTSAAESMLGVAAEQGVACVLRALGLGEGRWATGGQAG